MEDNRGNKSARSTAARLWARPPKARPMAGGGGNSPPYSPKLGGANSDGYSTMSEVPGGWCRRRRRCRNEKHLAPVCLDMPIFKSTNPNVDVTYTLWRFDMQGWLDQHDEASRIPHIFRACRVILASGMLAAESRDISMSDLLAHMDCTFGNIHDCDTMIRCLYEICQRENETVEEYML